MNHEEVPRFFFGLTEGISQLICVNYMQLPKMPVVDEAADMFNVMRDTRSRSVGNRRMGGSSFSREGYGGFDDQRLRGFGDFDSFSGSRDSGSRYRDRSGGF